MTTPDFIEERMRTGNLVDWMCDVRANLKKMGMPTVHVDAWLRANVSRPIEYPMEVNNDDA